MIDLSVYLITDADQCARRGLVATVAAAVRGGVCVVQLRDKQASDAELIAQGQALQQVLAGTGVPLIINDRIEVAKAVGADGVHVGQSDTAAREARAALGADAIIGLSVQTQALARAVDPGLVDYVGIGPVFATATKPDHSRPLGFDGLAAVCAASPVPAVAIGGLQAVHAEAVRAAGAQGMALVSAVCAAESPEQAAREIAMASRAAKQAACSSSPSPDARIGGARVGGAQAEGFQTNDAQCRRGRGISAQTNTAERSAVQASGAQTRDVRANDAEASDAEASRAQASRTQASRTQASRTQASRTQAGRTQAGRTQAGDALDPAGQPGPIPGGSR